MDAIPAEKTRWMDWFPRFLAWGTMMMPRIAPSRWSQSAARREANDLISEPFTVTAGDGVPIDAWYFPPQQAGGVVTPTTPDRPGVVFTHGWTETKEWHLRLARVFIAGGHPVILSDMRGHGRSGGHCTLGVCEPDDVRRVVDESARRGWVKDRVFSMGVSMGAAAALRHAALDRRVAGVVAYAPFASFIDAIHSYGRRYAPFLSSHWGVRGFRQVCDRRGLDLGLASPLEVINQLDIPMLLVVGERDINLPACDHARVLHRAAQQHRAQLVEVPEANHFNICMKQWPGLDDRVLAFMRQTVEARDAKPLG